MTGVVIAGFLLLGGAQVPPDAAPRAPARLPPPAALVPHVPPPPIDEAIAAAPADACTWPLLARYVERFVEADGRVVDRTDDGKSTSEGQAYALFFALVGGDRALFDRVLAWAETNLARGDLGRHLPAWKWGRKADGSWGVLDPNAASDADLWIAYALHEAGRLWNEPRYDALGARVLRNVEAREVAELAGLGPMLLPGPRGFVHEKGRSWRLNPSYLPPQLLRRFRDRGPWQGVLDSAGRLLRESAPRGCAADWVLYHRERGFGVDPVRGPAGSYDAIRVYLWAGFLDRDDPLRGTWAGAVQGLWNVWSESGTVPEVVDVTAPGPGHEGPPGFVAALLPEAVSRGDFAAAERLEAALARSWNGALYGDPPTYYDQNLILFARGFVEGRFSFDAEGRLQTRWAEGGCGE